MTSHPATFTIPDREPCLVLMLPFEGTPRLVAAGREHDPAGRVLDSLGAERSDLLRRFLDAGPVSLYDAATGRFLTSERVSAPLPAQSSVGRPAGQRARSEHLPHRTEGD
jgi:hypothetical protein